MKKVTPPVSRFRSEKNAVEKKRSATTKVFLARICSEVVDAALQNGNERTEKLVCLTYVSSCLITYYSSLVLSMNILRGRFSSYKGGPFLANMPIRQKSDYPSHDLPRQLAYLVPTSIDSLFLRLHAFSQIEVFTHSVRYEGGMVQNRTASRSRELWQV